MGQDRNRARFRSHRSNQPIQVTRIDSAFSPRRRAEVTGQAGNGGFERGIIASLGPRRQAALPRVRPSDLKPADILLSLGMGDISAAIHALDGGWYSHVALWTGDCVIESTDPVVRCCSLRESVEQGGRVHVDVYRHKRMSDAERARVVHKAHDFVGRSYVWGDLLLGSVIVSSGAFIFRGSERAQHAWLHLMKTLNQVFALDRERTHELVTCAELVARSYHAADVPIAINLQGLRRCDGPTMAATLSRCRTTYLRSHTSTTSSISGPRT